MPHPTHPIDPIDAATALIEIYGEAAMIEAALLVEEYNSTGNTKAEEMWLTVLEAIVNLRVRPDQSIH